MLLLAAVGVVYGDIGTSPLYTVNQLFSGLHAGVLPLSTPIVLGAISFIFWALTIIVSFKYLLFVIVADREGQGGVFALLGLLEEHRGKIIVGILLLILILSAGLLFGEGVMTPAISVLAATEGLALAAPALAPYVILIALAVITLVFAFQYKGAARLGGVFGPIMVLWFIAIAGLGLRQIIFNPFILQAINPLYAVRAISLLSFKDVLYLGAGVVLSVAGVEALYADLGHFGRPAIRWGWFGLVYPALLLSYFGQGAYLLSLVATHSPVGNVFYGIVPQPLLYPMIILATLAAVVASQALISGAYSLVAQAVALNYLPRFKIIHTNKKQEGQVYLPAVNWLLYIGAIVLVLAFQSSAALAGAYSFAVSAVMLTTTLAMLAVAVLWWHWRWWQALMVFGFFALIDGLFVVSSAVRFAAGGWVPVAIGLALFCVMVSWNWGRRVAHRALQGFPAAGGRTISELAALKKRLSAGGGIITDERGRFVEADRAVIFLTIAPVVLLSDETPIIVRAYMRRTGALPKHIILLYIEKSKTAHTRKSRYTITPFGSNIFGVTARFGFMEDANLHAIVAAIAGDIPVLKTDRYLVEAGAEELHPAAHLAWLARLRLRLFRLLQRLATPAYRYFGIESSTSLSTTTFHVYVDDHGSAVRLPELDLVA
jgi:KUP system potassium uptake protein